jgi:hypothetical protein
VVFREIKDVVKYEFLPREEEPEKIDFELKDNESESIEEQECKKIRDSYSSIEEIGSRKKATRKVYSPDFCSNFALFIIDGDTRTITEALDLEDGKLYKKAMVEEIASLVIRKSLDVN